MNKQPTPETDKAERMAYSQEYMVPTEFARKLERERDEAREEIKEWKTLCLWGGTPEHIHGFIRGQQSRIQHLECERDEAMELLASEKITRNHIIKRSVEVERERDEARDDLKHIGEYGTEEINAAVELRQKLATALLERDDAREKAERYRREANKFMLQRDEAKDKYATEATEHMLAVNKLCNERDEAQADCLEQARLLGMGSEREARLISERDDAREEAAHWKSEWEILEARLCGWKHPRDNGIIFEHEVIPVLRKERDEAKNEILGWENKWRCAVDMAARAELERDDAFNKLKELKDILR